MDYQKDSGGRKQSLWRLTVAGFCSNLVCIGLARFGYGPLLPAIIDAQWFDASQAAYLGAANLAGYLAGALLSNQLAKMLNPLWLLRLMMSLAVISFFACASPLNFAWFFIWRFLSGLAAGVVIILAMTTILPHVAHSRRGIVSGTMFMGVGTGIVSSGTLVPLLLDQGLTVTWLGLGTIAFLLTLLVWRYWPETALPPRNQETRHEGDLAPVRSLYVKYALNAFGLVPHMIFLVAYVADGLGQGIKVGAHYWVLFGLGAIVGPLITGRLGDLLGFRLAIRITLLTEGIVIALPLLGQDPILLIVSSVTVGAFTPGIVPLVLGRIYELLPDNSDSQKVAWSIATTSFAVFQAFGAYLMSFVFSHSDGNYRLLFAMGACACGIAFAIDLIEAVAVRLRPKI